MMGFLILGCHCAALWEKLRLLMPFGFSAKRHIPEAAWGEHPVPQRTQGVTWCHFAEWIMIIPKNVRKATVVSRPSPILPRLWVIYCFTNMILSSITPWNHHPTGRFPRLTFPWRRISWSREIVRIQLLSIWAYPIIMVDSNDSIPKWIYGF